MSTPHRVAENYSRYAEDVLAHYAELTSVTSSNSCSAFYRRLASDGAGGSAGGWFKPIPSDFVADVEILARKFLAPSEYRVFRKLYIDGQGDTQVLAVTDMPKLEMLYLKLGRKFEEFGLWPVTYYFQPQDLRGGRSA